MIELNLNFDFENSGFSRTHYKTEYKNKKYNIVIIHEKNFEEICLSAKDGEPSSSLKENIIILIDNKKYITKKINDYTSIIERI